MWLHNSCNINDTKLTPSSGYCTSVDTEGRLLHSRPYGWLLPKVIVFYNCRIWAARWTGGRIGSQRERETGIDLQMEDLMDGDEDRERKKRKTSTEKIRTRDGPTETACIISSSTNNTAVSSPTLNFIKRWVPRSALASHHWLPSVMISVWFKHFFPLHIHGRRRESEVKTFAQHHLTIIQIKAQIKSFH